MPTSQIGARIKALREQYELTQQDLAHVFGFNDRQTVSAIENGTRRLTADELLLVVDAFPVSLDYFTDPFLLVGEGKFSWRHSGLTDEELREYEQRAGRWIAAYRHLAPQVGVESPLLRRSLPVRPSSSNEAAMEPPRFARSFVVVLARAVDKGIISLRRTASLLDCTVESVGDLFAEHGLKRPVEL